MQSTTITPGLSALESAVLRTVVYSDVFDFPLTVEEVHRWLPAAATIADVEEAVRGEGLSRLLCSDGRYVTLSGREVLAGTRGRRAQVSAKLRRQAGRYGRLMGRLPLVRMVAITGSLAAENAEAGADLDFMVVTAPNRVWMARTFIMAVVRLARLRGVTVCPNYLISETAIELSPRDLYTARELLQMAPVSGHTTYQRLLAANEWWREVLPNHPAPAEPAPEFPGFVRRAMERLFTSGVFDGVERWLMRRKSAELRRRQLHAETVFDETQCKGHFDGWRARTEEAVRARMALILESRR